MFSAGNVVVRRLSLDLPMTEVEAERLERRIRQKAIEIAALGEGVPVDEFRGALEVVQALLERHSNRGRGRDE